MNETIRWAESDQYQQNKANEINNFQKTIYNMHLQTIFVVDVFTRAAIFVFLFCSKPKADLTCSTWTMTVHWTDEKDILSSHWSSTNNRTWCSPKTLTHNARAHTTRTIHAHTKKDTGGLDFRRQSHFYPKVSLSSTCNVTFKLNTTCSDPHFANNIISALT